MNSNQIINIGLGILLGAGITYFLSTNTTTNNMMMDRSSNTKSQLQNNEKINAHFIEQMIPHHEDAITMAKLALKKSQNQNIKNLSNAIITSQSKEISQMENWYKSWYGKDVPTDDQVMSEHGMMMGNSLHMGVMGDESDITSLETSTDFDREFLIEMIPHHQMAVMMANMLKNSTERPEMVKLAEDIITSQTKEIEQMRTWLNEMQ